MFKTCSAFGPVPAVIAITLAATLGMGPAQAQFFKDAQLEAALHADKPGDMARLARERAASAPADPQTVLLHAVLALERSDAAPRKDALARAETRFTRCATVPADRSRMSKPAPPSIVSAPADTMKRSLPAVPVSRSA